MIGQKLKTIRKARGFTQEKLAKEVGLSTITIKGYESNKFSPSLETLTKIAEKLEVPTQYFFAEDIDTTKIITLADAFKEYVTDIQHERDGLNLSDTEKALKNVASVLQYDNIKHKLNYDYDDDVQLGMLAFMGGIADSLSKHVWNGSSAIKYQNFDAIYLLGEIVRCLTLSAATVKHIGKTTANEEQKQQQKKELEASLLQELKPILDKWIDNYLYYHRTAPHYEKEIKEYFKKYLK